nr:hypothetical protein [Tanacetum cinerariifolium]
MSCAAKFSSHRKTFFDETPPCPAAHLQPLQPLPRPSYAPHPSGMAVMSRPPHQRRLFRSLSPSWRAVGGGSATIAGEEAIKPSKTLFSCLFSHSWLAAAKNYQVVAAERRYSHHSHTLWCWAMMAQPHVMSQGGQTNKTTTVVAVEPAVTTTAAPWWCWACGAASASPPTLLRTTTKWYGCYAETTAAAAAFPVVVAALVVDWTCYCADLGLSAAKNHQAMAVKRRCSYNNRTLWCRAVMAQPHVMSRGGQTPKTTTVVAVEPAVTTTAAPWWCWACGGDSPVANLIVTNHFWLFIDFSM